MSQIVRELKTTNLRTIQVIDENGATIRILRGMAELNVGDRFVILEDGLRDTKFLVKHGPNSYHDGILGVEAEEIK